MPIGINNDLLCKIGEICQRVLNATIDTEEFYALWPKEADNQPFLKLVYEDLVDAIYHTPGKWFSKGLDEKAWRKSDGYYIVLLDLALLQVEASQEKLVEVKNRMWERGIYDPML